MLFLGIDPGYAIVGYGVIKKEKSTFKAKEYGTIQTSPDIPIEERLLLIYNDCKKLLKEINPDVVAIEQLFFYKNVTTAMNVSQARGIVVLAAHQAKKPIVEATPLQIKQALTGYGKADKQQMQRMVQTLLKLKEIPKPDDAADALAVALYAAQVHNPQI
ncbi:MAG: crossover junction endodeoxyribonuclease RuvC [Candidatus Jacksonbacteria bacterium]|nr:crossover junction endodeoxyribonuclease RuvC [Candidatus Jacksonbacteria bacterium]MBT6034785.1 crossover junction endodeoxyribonuclease RuvC [Candidatus Jacksonbacteria bacterium]MBT6301091.1 crossover junction endodeoxyribonuclease RuvC [Candidatus Jacksonbacteria bacterium]MBT6955600.1 crossover junction endodeoxyribonuclease RuvC [Candidatus Jacksonbacteria bacterium]MBT7008620.1 crossover junction endodeoxyribonuclease RuvC [Candidatus Jacksonbacteria bacterium]